MASAPLMSPACILISVVVRITEGLKALVRIRSLPGEPQKTLGGSLLLLSLLALDKLLEGRVDLGIGQVALADFLF
jgi:hypothetical protein